MRRLVPIIAAATLLALFALVCFHPLARQPTAILVGPQRNGWNDLTTYFIPLHRYPRQCWDRFGQWPLWNPYKHTGTPHLGNPQAGLFYPPNWLCWWFEPAHVLSWSIVCHHWFAAVGAYVLCRHYGLQWLAALAGGGIFLAAPYLLAQSGEGHYAQIASVSWMPWIAWCFERFREDRPGSRAALAITSAFSFLAGHVQEWFFLFIILCSWTALDGIRRWYADGWRPSLRLFGRWIWTVAMTGTLICPELISIVVFSSQTGRSGGIDSDTAGAIGLSASNLFQLVNPFALGGPDSYGGRDKFFWETVCSFGTVPLLLAAVAIACRSGRYPIARLAVTASMALCYGFGSGSPVFYAMFHLVPGLSYFRAPSRVLFFCSFAVAILAANGVDIVIRSAWHLSETKRKRLFRSLAAAGFLFLVALPLVTVIQRKLDERPAAEKASGVSGLEANPTEHDVTSPGPNPPLLHRAIDRSILRSNSYLWLFITSGLAAAAIWRARYARIAAAGISILCAAQLASYSSKLFAALPYARFEPGNMDGAALPPLPAERFFGPREYLPDHRAAVEGVEKLTAYEPLPLARYAQYMTALTGRPDPTSVIFGDSMADLDVLSEHLLDAASVHQVAVPANKVHAIDSLGWQRAGERTAEPFGIGAQDPRTIVLFHNADALPRAYIVGQTRVASRSDAVAALEKLRPREEALMTAEFLPPGPRAPFQPARVDQYTPNRIVVEATLPAVGYLVLNDAWYPGWTATDNGKPTSIIPSNLAFRAIPLAMGEHRVELRYRPLGLPWSLGICAAGWLVTCGQWYWSSRIVRSDGGRAVSEAAAGR